MTSSVKKESQKICIRSSDRPTGLRILQLVRGTQRGPGLWDEVCSPKLQWRSLLALADLFVINCPYTPEEDPQRASACLCTCSCASLRLCLSGKGIRRCACRVSCPRAVCPRAVCRVRVSCVASAANSWPSARTGRRAHQISAGTLGTRASRATSTSASR